MFNNGRREVAFFAIITAKKSVKNGKNRYFKKKL